MSLLRGIILLVAIILDSSVLKNLKNLHKTLDPKRGTR
jgi:hypothetical protein